MVRKQLLLNVLSAFWGAWRRRYLIAVPIVIMPLVGLLYGIISPKNYLTYTTILIQEAAKQNPFLEDLAVPTRLKERIDALRALLHSRHILSPVARELGLIAGDTEREAAARTIAALSQSLRVELIGDDLVKLTHVAEQPEQMAEFLRRVSARFVERIIAPQRSSVANSQAFLASEIEDRRRDLNAIEQRLADYRSRNATDLPELHANNVKRLGRLQELLSEKRGDLNGAQGELKEMENRLVLTNPVVGRLDDQIVDTLSEIASFRARYTDKHSKLQGANRRLRNLEHERARLLAKGRKAASENIQRLWNLASSMTGSRDSEQQPLLISQLGRLQDARNRMKSLRYEVESLARDVGDLTVRIRRYGEHERRLTELRREIEIKRVIYQDLAQRHQLARVTGALGKAEERERVKIIDPPFAPLTPSSLPLFVFVLAGLAAGVALGAGLATVAELLDSGIYRADVLARTTGVPTLARIPNIPAPGLFDLADAGVRNG